MGKPHRPKRAVITASTPSIVRMTAEAVNEDDVVARCTATSCDFNQMRQKKASLSFGQSVVEQSTYRSPEQSGLRIVHQGGKILQNTHPLRRSLLAADRPQMFCRRRSAGGVRVIPTTKRLACPARTARVRYAARSNSPSAHERIAFGDFWQGVTRSNLWPLLLP